MDIGAQIYAEKPQLRIHSFEGIFIRVSVYFSSNLRVIDDLNNINYMLYKQEGVDKTQEPLSVENTLWSNTVLASGTAYGAIIYTGRETRSVMNTSMPENKVSKILHLV